MRRWCGVLLAGLLAGCASAPRAPATATTAGLAALNAWVATGRLAVAADQGGGSGNFVWRQNGSDTQLTVRGPLGAGAMEIASDGNTLTVTDSAGRSLGPDARAELAARLGVDLPLSSLRYWMLGLPWPDATSTVHDGEAPARRVIDQQGWTISYDAFREEQGLTLPARMTAATGTVRLKMIVDGWNLEPEPASARP